MSMSLNLGTLYEELFKEYKILNCHKTAQKTQQDFVALWNEAKNKYTKKSELRQYAENLLREFRQKNKIKQATNITKFFSFASKSQNKATSSATIDLTKDSENALESQSAKSVATIELLESSETSDNSDGVKASVLKRKYSTPAQDELKDRIINLEKEVNILYLRRDSMNADGSEKRQINELTKEIENSKKALNSLELHAKQAKRYRDNLRDNMKELKNKNKPSENAEIDTKSGRPRLEVHQPDLLKTIADIAMFGALAEERRRSEVVWSCKTLDELHARLLELGYKISRNALYIRLLPRRYNTLEGKRHVLTVPVKLSRPEADHHKAHPDQYFCIASIRNLETIASILGPYQVIFISQDDKARVPIGITAAKKQAPLLMHLDYKVSLPDHDFVVANQHKLIPSVYAGCSIKKNAMGKPEAVTYSGPTFIAIRSGKHSASTASSHAEDFRTLIEQESFKEIFRNEFGNVKPIIMISSDGGPDENPRFPKVISNAINHFHEYDLDVIIIFTNAPGRSAFNRVERRMAPLSRELSGLILPHDSCGTHLDSSGRTINKVLEKQNFRKAGEILAEIWSNMVIDNHSVVAQYVEPNPRSEQYVPPIPSQEWYSQHVRESHYMVQVVKCTDNFCCEKMKSSWLTVVPSRFLSGPIPIYQTSDGPYIPSPQDHDGKTFAEFSLTKTLHIKPDLDKLPYDFYCPSLQSGIADRTCKICGIYFCSKKAVLNHAKFLHSRKDANIEDNCDETEKEFEVEANLLKDTEEIAPIISIEESLQNPWTETD